MKSSNCLDIKTAAAHRERRKSAVPEDGCVGRILTPIKSLSHRKTRMPLHCFQHIVYFASTDLC